MARVFWEDSICGPDLRTCEFTFKSNPATKLTGRETCCSQALVSSCVSASHCCGFEHVRIKLAVLGHGSKLSLAAFQVLGLVSTCQGAILGYLLLTHTRLLFQPCALFQFPYLHAGSSSAALEPGCCLRPILDHPSLQQPQTQEWQQKRGQLLGCAARSSADLAPGCCLRRLLDHPRSQQPQIQEWQQKQLASFAWMRWTLLSCSWTWLLSPPYSGSPQVTTAPDSRIAAKALSGAWMCWTFLSCSCTWLLSPPSSGLPQVTTDSDSRMAAKALSGAWMCWTFLSCSCTSLLSPPYLTSPQAKAP